MNQNDCGFQNLLEHLQTGNAIEKDSALVQSLDISYKYELIKMSFEGWLKIEDGWLSWMK